ncbi:MAG: terminase family protein [Chitinispirillia bacterium]|nr:terminase family protein [Chitinispirillia bacterium]MCL2268591.1 terminase family protein [Chitinispirillia bacterium]
MTKNGAGTEHEIYNYFLLYQREWIDDESPIKVWEKSRRIGATYTQAYEDVRDIVTRKEYTPGRPIKRVYFSSKDEEAGKEYIEYCQRYAEVFNVVAKDMGIQVIDEKNGVKASVLEFANGGKILALSSAPTAFNSKGGKIVWDEAALHKDQRAMWSGAQPAAGVWGYPIRILSTHKGKSTLFYRFCERIRKGQSDWSLHRVTIVDAVGEGLCDKVFNRKTSEQERNEYIERLRSSCQDSDIFNEDYMAEPIDATTAYITYEMIEACENATTLRSLDDLSITTNALYAGWDIGRKRDLSVIWVLEDVGAFLATRVVKEFDRTAFKIQEAYLDLVMRLPHLRRICIDQTGIGLPLTEAAQERYGKSTVEGVTFTSGNKEALAVGTRNALEDRRVILPNDAATRESIHSIKRMVTSAGNIRFDAERTDETGHADRFWALALAIHAKTGGPSGPAWAESRGVVLDRFNRFTDNISMGYY